MRSLVLLGIASLAASLPVEPAQALPRTWVASNGSGTTCSRAAPCADFQTAHNATDPGGEINCVDALQGDPAALVTLTLSKSITIDCAGALGASGKGAVNPSVNVNGDGIVVRLRNLTFQGGAGGPLAINFINGAALIVEHCAIYGFRTTNGNGILFAPAGSANLFVSDTSIQNNGIGVSAGIMIKPGSGTVTATIVRSQIEFNTFGIIADGTSGAVRGVVRDSVVSDNTNNGITVSSPGPSVVLTVEGTTVSGNKFGLVATGANAGMLVRRSVINSNTTGLNTGSGGVLLSYGDNSVNGNNAGETFTGPVGLK